MLIRHEHAAPSRAATDLPSADRQRADSTATGENGARRAAQPPGFGGDFVPTVIPRRR